MKFKEYIIKADPETDNAVIIGDRASYMEALFKYGGKYGIFAKYGHGNQIDLTRVEELRASSMDIQVLESVYNIESLNKYLSTALKAKNNQKIQRIIENNSEKEFYENNNFRTILDRYRCFGLWSVLC